MKQLKIGATSIKPIKIKNICIKFRKKLASLSQLNLTPISQTSGQAKGF
jgi:hypothetical protein